MLMREYMKLFVEFLVVDTRSNLIFLMPRRDKNQSAMAAVQPSMKKATLVFNMEKIIVGIIVIEYGSCILFILEQSCRIV